MAKITHFPSTVGEWKVIDTLALVTLLILMAAAITSKIAQYYGFSIHDWDTGIYSNLIWNIISGDGFYSDINLKNQLGEHFSPIVVIFVPLFLLNPSPLWLLAAQGLAVGTTYILIYFIAQKIFDNYHVQPAKILALIFAIWAFFYRPLTSALLFEFHPSTLATPLLAGAVLALLCKRDRLLWVLVSGLLLSKENAPLAILGLGIYAWLVLSRPRMGAALIAAAVVSAALIMIIVMPLFQVGAWEHYDRLALLAKWRPKALYLYWLVKDLAFLPLASWRSLICAAPLVAVNLSVDYWPQFSLLFHYDDFASVFLLLAAIHGANALLSGIGSTLERDRAVWTAVMAIVAAVLVELRQESVISRTSWPGDAEWQLYQEIAPYRRLPLDIGVAADNALGPYLSTRQRYAALRQPYLYAPKRYTWDLARLRPGDLVLITPTEDGPCAETERLLEESVIFVKLHMSSVLCVYEVTAVRPTKASREPSAPRGQ